MFSKIDKNILIILMIFTVFILSSGFIFYRYMLASVVDVQNLIGGAQTEINNEI
jgi:hypothetical protein